MLRQRDALRVGEGECRLSLRGQRQESAQGENQKPFHRPASCK